MATIQFLGATGTVTGSKYVVDAGGERLMIDCGLFQGEKELRERNWQPLPLPPSSINWLVLTHAHLDHIGYIPRLINDGFRGQVLASTPTVELAKLVLPDSGHLQEEDAEHANFKGFTRHKPALPLYTYDDAVKALEQFRAIDDTKPLILSPRFELNFFRAGHILGARMIEVTVRENGTARKVLFGGDLGRFPQIILYEPEVPDGADYLLVESTYGDRLHPKDESREHLSQIVESTASRGGTVVIPSFAIGRTQELLYLLRELIEQGKLSSLPVHVDSPMGIDVTDIYMRHTEEHDIETQAVASRGLRPFSPPDVHFDRTRAESIALNDLKYPMIIISAGGMATGGRILHHLERCLPDHRNTVLFVGFQGAGTRGQIIKSGAEFVKMHGRQVRIRARIESMENMSAHADYGEILSWLGKFHKPPRTTFLVHGEPKAAEALKGKITEHLRWNVEVPSYLQKFAL
ncbi:MAG: MBL fold metallo-hydrolase [Acidobacteria bacterium]|nr:MBL fold metallo-hydrolase [Acidobacteriota bacterium]